MIIKKWTILLITFMAIILAIYFLTKEKNSIKNLKQETAEQGAFVDKKQSFDSVAENSAVDSVALAIEKKIIQEEVLERLTKEEMLEKLASSSAFPSKSTQIIALHQKRQSDPTITLKISDFSQKEQESQSMWLKSYTENGYIQTSSVSFDYIQSQNELVELVEADSSDISIPLQDISSTKLSEYEYLGIVLKADEVKREQEGLESEIKRAFRGKDGQEVFLLEKSVKGSTAILVEEFVTEKISGYPASRMTYCTEDQRCMSQITLITKDKLYEVSAYGDQGSTKDKLIDIISSVDLPSLDAE